MDSSSRNVRLNRNNKNSYTILKNRAMLNSKMYLRVRRRIWNLGLNFGCNISPLIGVECIVCPDNLVAQVSNVKEVLSEQIEEQSINGMSTSMNDEKEKSTNFSALRLPFFYGLLPRVPNHPSNLTQITYPPALPPHFHNWPYHSTPEHYLQGFSAFCEYLSPFIACSI